MHAKGYSMANEFKATVVETRAWARRTGDARGRRQLSGGGRRGKDHAVRRTELVPPPTPDPTCI
jgi:hypothetical protein